MKTAKTLTELAIELERQHEAKNDLLATSAAVKLEQGQRLVLTNGKAESFDLTELGHSQLAERAGIPKRYYDDIRVNHPALADVSVNTLLPAKGDRHLIRTLDGKARAVLSPSFRCLDNAPFLKAILPPLASGGFKIESCEVTDTRLYVKVTSPTLTAEFPILARGGHSPVNEVVQAGFWFRNSEVGHSRLAGGLFFKVLRCTNGLMLTSEFGFARNHSGKAIEFNEAVEQYFKHETRALDDQAYWAKLGDIVTGMIGSEGGFKSAVERFRLSSGQRIEGSPVAAVEQVAEVLQLNKPEKDGVLRHLIEGGELSRWGMSNALTRFSADVDDYDRASDFEAFGGRIIDLPQGQWEQIATAA